MIWFASEITPCHMAFQMEHPMMNLQMDKVWKRKPEKDNKKNIAFLKHRNKQKPHRSYFTEYIA